MKVNQQPTAIIYLSLSELWERFGFYILQGLLVLLLTNYFKFSDARAYQLSGEYSALVLIMPLLGGLMADKLMGYRASIISGAILLGLGYAVFSILTIYWIYLGLAMVVMGNALLKPNISSFLGTFYQVSDHRRDAGFTLFYMGINIGGLLSLTLGGFLKQHFNWHVPFYAAALGMIISLCAFCAGFNSYHQTKHHNKEKIPTSNKRNCFVGVLIILGILLSNYLLRYPVVAGFVQVIMGGSLFIWLLFFRARSYDTRQRAGLWLAMILTLFSMFWWAIYFQEFSSIILFIDRMLASRELFGIVIPKVALLALEPMFIVILGIPFASLWRYLNASNSSLRLPQVKFTLGLFLAALQFVILLAAIYLYGAGNIPLLFLILFFLIFTIGEMMVSPIGLSMMSAYAPKDITALMMGIWFLFSGLGGQLSAWIATMTAVPTAKRHNLQALTHAYFHGFSIAVILSLVVGLVLLALMPWFRHLQRQIS